MACYFAFLFTDGSTHITSRSWEPHEDSVWRATEEDALAAARRRKLSPDPVSMTLHHQQEGYGAEFVRAVCVNRPDHYTRGWGDPVGPETDLGPRLFHLSHYHEPSPSRPNEPPRAVYYSMPDDGREAVEVTWA